MRDHRIEDHVVGDAGGGETEFLGERFLGAKTSRGEIPASS